MNFEGRSMQESMQEAVPLKIMHNTDSPYLKKDKNGLQVYVGLGFNKKKDLRVADLLSHHQSKITDIRTCKVFLIAKAPFAAYFGSIGESLHFHQYCTQRHMDN